MGRKSKISKENNTSLILRDPNTLDADTVAMSALFWERHLAVKSETRQWSLLQQTLFIIALRQLRDWTKGDNNNTVILNNRNVMQELGWDLNEKNFRKMGDVLRTEFTHMVSHSTIRLQDAKTKKWIAENLIIGAEGDSRITKVTINPKFMNHFEDLFFIAFNFGQSFHQILEPDIASFKSKHSYLLFTDLRVRCEVKKEPVEGIVKYSIEDLKTLFELNDKDYMQNRDDDKKKYSGFNYTSFEKKVLNVAIDEVNCSEQIKILPWDDGKFYEKRKVNRKVDSYVLKFKVLDPDTIRYQRTQLLETAKSAGLDFKIYPNFKETSMIDPKWESKWHVDRHTTKALPSSEKNNKPEKRKDKITEDANALFSINPDFKQLKSEKTDVRPITRERLEDMEKARVQRIEELQKEIDRLQSEKIII